MSSKIKDGLFMGDIDAAQDADFLQLNGITHIVNCVPRQMPNIFQQSLGLSYTACDLEETLRRPFFDLKNRGFVHLIYLIDRALERTESVLVHSLNGLNRSPSIMIGYLMVKYCWGVDKAHEFVMSKRLDMKLHESYIDQLCALEAQLIKDRPALATERQLYEWSALSVDLETDEIVLIHTFLNSATQLDDKAALDKQRCDASKHHRELRLSWIDQTHAREFSPWLLERPPNHSYNKVIAGDGWVDLLNPSSGIAHQIINKEFTGEDGGLHTKRLAFADLSIIGKLDALPSGSNLDQFGLGVNLEIPGIAEVPISRTSKRLHSLSAPKRFEVIEDEASTCPSTISEELDIMPGDGSSTMKFQYSRDILILSKNRPRHSSSSVPSAPFTTKRSSLPANVRNSSTCNIKGLKTPSAALKGALKKTGNMASALGSRNSACSGRVFNSVDLPPQSSAVNFTRSKLNGRNSTGSIRPPTNKKLQKPASIRPRTAPPRIRTGVESKDLLDSKKFDLDGVGRAMVEPMPSHRLHSSLDYINGEVSSVRGARRTSASNGTGRIRTARASWR